MKKLMISLAVFATALFAVSCQKEIAPEFSDNASTTGKLTATIVQTKVSYTETAEKDLQPAWEVGDKIIGFNDAGSTYTFTVTEVKSNTATLSADKTIGDGTYHLIYKSGAQASDISSKTLAVDYDGQSGNKTMPAVMLADGTVKDGACAFSFTNAGAIVGISAVKGIPSGAAISKITVEGANLSAATVALSGSALALTATPAATDAISTAALSGITVTDANGQLSSIVYVAVPAGAKIAKVSATVAARTPETMTIPSTAADKKDIDYVEIAAKYDGTNVTTKKWAKWNVGANNEKDYGWYFAWGATEGYVRKNDKWVSASGVDSYSYTLSSAKTAVASDYLYVKSQNFAAVGHSFDYVNTPYQTQNTEDHSSLKYTKYLGSTSSSYKDPSATDADALKTVLDPEDDAAHVNWGGEWRMPTVEEFRALYDATYWAWDATDEGYYVFKADATHTAGASVSSIPSELSKDDALLFFPAAGYGTGASLNIAGTHGNYWSSSLSSSSFPFNAKFLYFFPSGCLPQGFDGRCYGRSIRPVLGESVEPQPLPEGALPGEFSVSETKKIHFSKGNLYCKRSGSEGNYSYAFQFEDQQYKFHCRYGEKYVKSETGKTIAEADFATTFPGLVYEADASGLFQWDVTKAVAGSDYGAFGKDKNVTITSSDSMDWGSSLGDGVEWFSLSIAEWAYILEDREDHDRLNKLKATVCGVPGTIIAPNTYNGEIADCYNEQEWAYAENNDGLVFFPAAGIYGGLYGSSVNSIGASVYYQTPDPYIISNKSSRGILFNYLDNSYGVGYHGYMAYVYDAHSVRLVCEE